MRHGLARSAPLHRRLLQGWKRLQTAAPPPLPETTREEQYVFLRIAGLWCLAVAQPIFDLVGRSPEFFIAHDTQPGQLLVLVALICLGGPGACLLIVRAVGVAGPPWRRRAEAALYAGLAGLIVLIILNQWSSVPARPSVALAALVGAAAAAAIRRLAPVRTFATLLASAVLIAPAVFLLKPDVKRMLTPQREVMPIEGVELAATPPIVLVVFDQFQLGALLDRQANIDRAAFPNFAALADDAIWFRNATAVAEYTTYALPALLTGMRPSLGLPPTAAEHPANLFTLLGGHYGLHVQEPLTQLCPETLCPTEATGFVASLAAILQDLAIAYLTVALPEELASPLPPVNQSWKDFAASGPDDLVSARWAQERAGDRRRTFDEFISAIDQVARPTLHFAHVLLPHEPFIYLPTGQQFTFHRRTIGLRDDMWNADRWAAALNHHRYLLQVGFVDEFLGRLVARLREVGIYDDALIVVTADHGCSLRPGHSFRAPSRSTFADVAAVPLFLKMPAQVQGSVVDANVEVIDIVPTLAAALGIDLPWSSDGSNVLDPEHEPRPSKVLLHENAGRRMEVPGDQLAALRESASSKFEWLDDRDPMAPPRPERRYDDLVGEAVDPMRAESAADLEVTVDPLPMLQDLDLSDDFLPAHITGAVADPGRGQEAPALAIALNDRVAAVTRPYPFRVDGRNGMWEAIIPPGRLVAGRNSLEVLEVRERAGGGGFTLAATGAGQDVDQPLNLIRRTELEILNGRATGFHGEEWVGAAPLRWTDGNARLNVPFDPRKPPAVLEVDVALTGMRKRLSITVDGCEVFDQDIDEPWSAEFSLEECRLSPPSLSVVLRSDTHVPYTHDTRELGIGVSRISLLAPP